jgi:hypothetical protein
LLHTRIWELLLGALLAVIHFKNALPSFLKRHASLIAGFGFVLCLLALFILNAEHLFPGAWALLPTVGAFLIILAGPESWLNRTIFSSKPMVYVGLISYPLYLWHWPLFSFGHIIAGELSLLQSCALIVASFVGAIATFELVEKPLRKFSWEKKKKLAVVLCVIVAIAGLTGHLIKKKKILAYSHDERMVRVLAAKEDWGFPVKRGLYEHGSGSQTILFIGDSNIQQYYPRMKTQVRPSQKLVFVTSGSCPPIPDMRDPRPYTQDCPQVLARALELAQNPAVTTVVLGSLWIDKFVKGTKFYIKDESNRTEMGSLGQQMAMEALGKTLRSLKAMGKKTFLVLNIPIDDAFDASAMFSRSFSFKPVGLKKAQFLRKDLPAEFPAMQRELRLVGEREGAIVIDPMDFLCNETSCPTTDAEGMPIYRDARHLRATYTRDHVKFLDQVLE